MSSIRRLLQNKFLQSRLGFGSHAHLVGRRLRKLGVGLCMRFRLRLRCGESNLARQSREQLLRWVAS